MKQFITYLEVGLNGRTLAYNGPLRPFTVNKDHITSIQRFGDKYILGLLNGTQVVVRYSVPEEMRYLGMRDLE